jgi:hypothetical protein
MTILVVAAIAYAQNSLKFSSALECQDALGTFTL